MAYLKFNNIGDALNFPTTISIDGEDVNLWHRGKFTCATCGEKGHSERFHDKVVMAKNKDKRRRQAFKQRK